MAAVERLGVPVAQHAIGAFEDRLRVLVGLGGGGRDHPLDAAVERVEQDGIRGAQVDREVQLLRDAVEDRPTMHLPHVVHRAFRERGRRQGVDACDGIASTSPVLSRPRLRNGELALRGCDGPGGRGGHDKARGGGGDDENETQATSPAAHASKMNFCVRMLARSKSSKNR